MYKGLVDLDELVVRCRDTQSREIIAEAIASYHAGAYRAAIVTTWLAVYFDIASKIRSLAIGGNARAVTWTEALDRHSARYNPEQPETASPLLKIERSILNEAASTDYELISNVELYDLKRLRTDRNRCAHPSMLNEGERFQPTAELVRTHIRNAIVFVLARPPIQGRLAVERFLSTCSDPGFPITANEALQVLDGSGIADIPGRNLERIFSELLGDIFETTSSASQRTQRLAAIESARQQFKSGFSESFGIRINDLIKLLDGEQWAILMGFLAQAPWVWSSLSLLSKNNASLAVENADTAESHGRRLLVEALNFDPLSTIAVSRLANLSITQLASGSPAIPSHLLLDEAIRRLQTSSSFDETRRILRLLVVPNIALMNTSTMELLLTAYLENRQVRDATSATTLLYTLLDELHSDKRGSEGSWRRVLAAKTPSVDSEDQDLVSKISEVFGASQ